MTSYSKPSQPAEPSKPVTKTTSTNATTVEPKGDVIQEELDKAKTERIAESLAKENPRPKAAPKKPAPKKTPLQKPQVPVAGPVTMKTRHYGLVLSFFLLFVAPTVGAGYYLYTAAKDQFVSEVGFTVRREDAPLVSNLLNSLGQVSSASSTDSDILFEYVRSKEMVQQADEVLNLRALFSEFHDIDPVFSLKPDANIEELVAYWNRMVQVSYAPGTGLLELNVRAFDPNDAREIAEVIFSEGTSMINELSNIARADTTRYASQDLAAAENELQQVRQSITNFRLRTQIVDPQAAIQGQMGLLNSLQQQLGEALIEADLLKDTTRETDPRLAQIQVRIEAIQERIAQERQKFGQGGDAIDGQDYATVIAEFERLAVEREFAEQKYATALSNLNVAQAEALRQSRYLAAFVGPTLAESPEHPRRFLVLGLFGLFALLTWAILTLIYYSLRDRR